MRLALSSWSGLRWTALLFIFKLIFSFLVITWWLYILHITRCLLKSRMPILLSSRTSNLIFINIFLTWICFLNAALISFYSSPAIVTEYFWFFYRCWTDWRLLYNFFILIHFLSHSKSFIHSPSNINNWRTN